jgi:hypothetical protein
VPGRARAREGTAVGVKFTVRVTSLFYNKSKSLEKNVRTSVLGFAHSIEVLDADDAERSSSLSSEDCMVEQEGLSTSNCIPEHYDCTSAVNANTSVSRQGFMQWVLRNVDAWALRYTEVSSRFDSSCGLN